MLVKGVYLVPKFLIFKEIYSTSRRRRSRAPSGGRERWARHKEG
jgi:hypothetical protein